MVSVFALGKMCNFLSSLTSRIFECTLSTCATSYKLITPCLSVENCIDLSQMPGPKSYPIIGTLHKYLPFIGDYYAEAMDRNAWLNWRRYGPLVREMPGINLVHIFDPDVMEAVFRQDDRYPARRSHVAMYHYRMNKAHVYNTGGLLSTNGPDWWRLRSTFQKNFTSPESAKQYVNDTDDVVREFVEFLKTDNVSFNDDLLPYLNRLNLEVIGKVAFNERFNSFAPKELDRHSRSSKTIEAAFGSNAGIMKLDKGILWKLFTTPLYKKLVKSQEYLEKVSTDLLLKKVHFLETDDDDSDKSLLKAFIQHPNIDFKDLVGMSVDILMAAIDTTAYATAFALYHLARNPKCQEDLYKEALSLLPDKNMDITAEVLSKAVYLRCCVKESLRLNPVAIGVGRLLQNDIVINNYWIPKGTVIVTQNMVASRLPQYVNDPLSYKPERWHRGSEHYEKLHPFLSLPFGFGPRSCIARRLAEQNMCITLLRLVRSFDMKWMGKELGVRTLLINKPDQPITISFNARIK